MKPITVVLNLITVLSALSKKFDALSLHGISLTDFMILHILHHESGNRLRRIDLAERTGLTASGITRLLLPLEKIGLVKRERNVRDARVSYVKLTKTGSQIYKDAAKTADRISSKITAQLDPNNLESLNKQLIVLGGQFTS